MKFSTLEKYFNILTEIKNSNVSIKTYCNRNNINIANIRNIISKIETDAENRSELASKILDLYMELSNIQEVLFSEDIESDNKTETSYERDLEGNIKYYKYTIHRKNKRPLSGRLTCEEMATIYRLYTYYGDNLTARVVSRHFPDLSLVDLKRIIRAFGIFKDNCPFPPHYIERYSEKELREIQIREKENSFMRKAEEDNIKNTEKLLRKYAQENIDLKNQIEQRKDLLNELLNKNITIDTKYVNKSNLKNTDLIIVLSDLHIGAFNEKFGYVQLESYTEDEINRRLNKILDSIPNNSSSITVLNLGDSVDSYNKQTTRGGHDLPSVVSNKEQSMLFQRVMLEFFSKLSTCCDKIKYICVGESNHDGDWGWINNVALSYLLKEKFNVESYISNNPIDVFNIQDSSFLFLHGKDNKNQFKNFPLVLNDKTESWFNNYFLDGNFKSRKYVIKGDLHQYAYSCAKHFDYISAPSLYGSSNWITANFGKTPWGALLIKVNNNNLTTELIKD